MWSRVLYFIRVCVLSVLSSEFSVLTYLLWSLCLALVVNAVVCGIRLLSTGTL